jgi:4-hydroxy-3-methylbut-2-enyl diphosphate reductase
MQTTLSHQDTAPLIAGLRDRFPALAEPAAEDICFATRNRQAAVAWLARQVDVVLVVGDPTSSNSQRLCEEAVAAGARAYLLASVAQLEERWLANARVVGVSAGASTPEPVVADVVDHFRRSGAALQDQLFLAEHVAFRLPREVVSPAATIGS